MRRPHVRALGFTVIELLVVLAAIGLLLAVAAPRYSQHVDQAREVALKQDLRALRDAIDKFYADQARYPATLDELVVKRYLRGLPVDPITERTDSWLILAPTGQASGAIFDIRSGAKGTARDGSAYATW
ncbi:MAG: prepilin-type N-terminal cleavage/methylation domain-containing protein [Burkholderiales bacterium]|nr:prepilin-type N-terminal cleavage/methylation domain-containing protein [Burkholderiales bacterium]